MFSVVSGYLSTRQYVDAVRLAADQDRDALGFFPASVFAEFARKDQLYVLLLMKERGPVYAGHALFDCQYPRAVVRQIHVVQEARSLGGAHALLQKLKDDLTELNFTSIYARVAADLSIANIFWEKQGFRVQRVEPGGATRNRTIFVRCHELQSRQLFPSSGVDQNNPLGLKHGADTELPLYLVDLNVLYDLGPRRLRHAEATALFAAERMNFCRLAISTELGEELRRSASPGRTDPMADYIRIYPAYPLTEGPLTDELVRGLATTVFPQKSDYADLTRNEVSDLRHVATAIQHRLAGFITNDGAILNAAREIHVKHGIQVTSPAAFQASNASPPTPRIDVQASPATQLNLQPLALSEIAGVHQMLSALGLSGSTISAAWLPPHSSNGVAFRYGVWSGTSVAAYLTWSSAGPGHTVIARVAVDESKAEAMAAARIVLLFLIEQFSEGGPRQVQLDMPPQQSYVREFASALGFSRNGTTSLRKVLLGRIVSAHNWDDRRAELLQKVALKLPDRAPIFNGIGQQVPILTPDGNQVHLDLEAIESLLTPALFCVPGRPAVITPLQRQFSELLVGHSSQLSLLPRSSVSLFNERHYISGSNTLKSLSRGTVMLIYESTKGGGRGAIVAMARVRGSYLKPADALGELDLDASVLSRETLEKIGTAKLKTVTAFDNIFRLPLPVPLQVLRKLGCGRPNDLITTRSVSDEQLQGILKAALP